MNSTPQRSPMERDFLGVSEEEFLDSMRRRVLERPTNAAAGRCLSSEELEALACGRRTPRDVAENARHVAVCPGCLPLYLGFKRRAQPPIPRFPRAMTWSAAAALAALAGVGIYWFTTKPASAPTVSRVPISPRTSADPLLAARRGVLDLRPFDAARGTTSRAPGRLSLERADYSLELLLPVGSEPGSYELEIRGPAGAKVAQASGVASLRDFVTRLKTDIDLRPLNAGRHSLAVRHRSESVWRSYSIEID